MPFDTEKQMPVLRATNVEAALMLEFLSGDTRLQLTKDGAVLLLADLVMSDHDFLELGTQLADVAEERSNETRVEITDGDFIVEAERLISANDISFRFWYGEPYMLMRGYRFVVETSALKEFASELIGEARRQRLS